MICTCQGPSVHVFILPNEVRNAEMTLHARRYTLYALRSLPSSRLWQACTPDAISYEEPQPSHALSLSRR